MHIIHEIGEVKGKGAINSKRKGGANELVLAKAFSKWTGVKFMRTPSSGAIHVAHSAFAGDIVCADPNFYFPITVETKVRKRGILPDSETAAHGFILLRKNTAILKFWKQVANDAERVGTIPLLFVREDFQKAGTWVVFMDILTTYATFKYRFANSTIYLAGSSDSDVWLVGLPSEDFFSKISAKELAQLKNKK